MTGKEAKERLKKQYNRQNTFIKDNYDRLSVTVPKGYKETIKGLLQHGETINSIINDLLRSWIAGREENQTKETELFPDLSDDFPFH